MKECYNSNCLLRPLPLPMKRSLIYTLKVWLTSIPITTLVIVIYNHLVRGLTDRWGSFLFGVAGLSVFSIPTMFAFLCMCNYLSKRKHSLYQMKFTLGLIAYALGVITFIYPVILTSSGMENIFVPCFTLSIVTAGCSVIYNPPFTIRPNADVD